MSAVPVVEVDSPAEVLTRAGGLRRAADLAEAELLVMACAWADLHPDPDDEGTAFEDEHLPEVHWKAPAEFALSVGLSDAAGTRMIHEALELRHRLPRVWRRVLDGEVPAWRARRVATTSLGRPDDVAAYLDEHVVAIAHRVGFITLERLLEEAMLRLYPEERELEQLERLARRRVKVYDDVSFEGIAHMLIDGDLKDVLDFDDAVTLIAKRLGEDGCPESFDVRRSMAVGVLADPAAALAMLNRASSPTARRKKIVLHVHLTDAALRGIEPVARVDHAGRVPVLEQLVREWCGRDDTHLTVQPVVDLADHIGVDQYEVPDRLRVRVDARDLGCVFPHCRRPASRCDHDHAVPHASGGSTCSCNLAPLCRRHHRLKTHTAWSYTVLEPGVYLWRSPHGSVYQRDHRGTENVTPRPPPHSGQPPHTGCLRDTGPPTGGP